MASRPEDWLEFRLKFQSEPLMFTRTTWFAERQRTLSHQLNFTTFEMEVLPEFGAYMGTVAAVVVQHKIAIGVCNVAMLSGNEVSIDQ